MADRKRIEVVAAVIVDGERVLSTQRGSGEWKDYWEFPGGKIEPGETREEALRREIREELNVDVQVGELLTTVDYDYPTFHLTMHCFRCSLSPGDRPTLLEHEAARWLTTHTLRDVRWLPADEIVVARLIND